MLPFRPDANVEEAIQVPVELREIVARLVREEVSAQMSQLEQRLLNRFQREDVEREGQTSKLGQSAPKKQRSRMREAVRSVLNYKKLLAPQEESTVEIELANRGSDTGVSFAPQETVASFADVLQVSDVNSVHVFNEDIWEACVLINSEALSGADMLSLSLSLILNIMAQITVVSVVAEFFLNDEERFPDIPTVRKWRQTSAHDYWNMDLVSGASLASQVCNNDLSISLAVGQQTMLREIRFYTGAFGPFETGPLLCSLVLLIWFAICLQEVNNSIDFYRAISSLPRSGTRIIFQDNNEFRLSSIGFGKQIFISALTLLRIFITARLLWVGALWLVYTKAMEGLVVNALALAFVLDIAAILFTAFVSTPAKSLLRALQPLRIARQSAKWKPTISVLSMVGGFLFVLYLLEYKILPEMTEMKEIRHLACGGDVDFVIGVQASTKEILAVSTKPFGASQDHQTFEQKAVDELIHARNSDDLVQSRYYNESSYFQLALGRSILKLAGTRADCADIFGVPLPWEAKLPQHMLSWRETLRHHTGVHSGKKCEDFQEACFGMSQQLLRLLCPQTCGCDNPRSGLFFSGPGFGCPSACREGQWGSDMQASMLPCEEVSSDEVSDKSSPWWNFLRQMRRVHPEYGGQGMATFHHFSAYLQTDGCQGVTSGPKAKEMLCGRIHENFGSLVPWCPKACGCRSSDPPKNCPQDCLIKK